MKQIQLERYVVPKEVARCVEVTDVGPAGSGEVVFGVFPVSTMRQTEGLHEGRISG